MDKISVKGECTVNVRDGESLSKACLRSINEAIYEVNEKAGYQAASLSEYRYIYGETDVSYRAG